MLANRAARAIASGFVIVWIVLIIGAIRIIDWRDKK